MDTDSIDALSGAKRERADEHAPGAKLDSSAQPSKRRIAPVPVAAEAREGSSRRADGDAAMQKGDHAAALEHYAAHLAAEPSDLAARAAHAHALHGLGRTADAISAARGVLDELSTMDDGLQRDTPPHARLQSLTRSRLAEYERAAGGAGAPSADGGWATPAPSAGGGGSGADSPGAADAEELEGPAPRDPALSPPPPSRALSLVPFEPDGSDEGGEAEIDVARLRALSDDERQQLVDRLAEVEAAAESSLEELEEVRAARARAGRAVAGRARRARSRGAARVAARAVAAGR